MGRSLFSLLSGSSIRREIMAAQSPPDSTAVFVTEHSLLAAGAHMVLA